MKCKDPWLQFRRRSLTLTCAALWIVAVASVVGSLIASPSTARAQANNSVLNQLWKHGVPVGQNNRLLPPLTMSDGLNADAQKTVVKGVLKLSKGRQLGYEEFTQNNLNAPYVLVINAPQNPPSVDLWFVVWGDLKKITAPAFLRKQFQLDENVRIDVLKPADLPMGINAPLPPGNAGGEWYAHGVFTLISNDKRVRIEGTAHTAETVTNDSGTIAGIVDQRFNDNAKFPNQWQPILRDANGSILKDAKGQPQLGPPVPYDSAGGFIKVTKLVQPAGALFVEYHLVYEEPKGWFNGRDLLRAKLRLKTEEDVRSFRRQVIQANGP
jgi:hypothetical protein